MRNCTFSLGIWGIFYNHDLVIAVNHYLVTKKRGPAQPSATAGNRTVATSKKILLDAIASCILTTAMKVLMLIH
jgi:hypothetical protein